MKTVTLQNVDLAKLKGAFNRSLSISSSDALNFRINNTMITDAAQHQSQSLFKRWSVNLTDVCSSVEGEFSELKVAVYAGRELTSKIFNFFGQLADLVFHHIDGNVTKIEFLKKDDKGRVALRIVLVTASVKTAFIEIDKTLISEIFDRESSSIQLTFKPEDLIQLNKLASLTTNPESQTAYISIFTKDGQLIATDGAFDVALYDTDATIEKIDIDKELFSCIEAETYTANIYHTDRGSMMLLHSQDSASSIAVVLLSEADDSIDWDEFEEKANWDAIEN